MTRNESNIFCTNLTPQFERFCDAFYIFGDVQSLEDQYQAYISRKKDVATFSKSSNAVFHSRKRRKVEDLWISNARNVYSSIQQMNLLLESNSMAYSNPQNSMNSISNQDTDNFESSIASFITYSASQIDSLRQYIPESLDDTNNNRLGIVSHLLYQLKVITDKFQELQCQRNREELELLRDPLRCSPSVISANATTSHSFHGKFLIDGLADSFFATLEEEEESFQQFYQKNDNDEELEKVLITELDLPCDKHDSSLLNTTQSASRSVHTEKPVVRFDPKFAPSTPKLHQRLELSTSDSFFKQKEIELRDQEQELLVANVQNSKLDGVQRAESQMLHITTLLSQFANLISEQQEEVQVIADATKKSRENVDYGREKLVQATEQRKKGRHYFAWIIFILGSFLMFMNAVVS